jgi:hypothetical protein
MVTTCHCWRCQHNLPCFRSETEQPTCPGCGHHRANENPYNHLDGKRWWYCLRCCLTFSTARI